MFKTSGLVTLEVFEMVQKGPLLVQLEVHEIDSGKYLIQIGYAHVFTVYSCSSNYIVTTHSGCTYIM